jgi:hypothetical protein
MWIVRRVVHTETGSQTKSEDDGTYKGWIRVRKWMGVGKYRPVRMR